MNKTIEGLRSQFRPDELSILLPATESLCMVLDALLGYCETVSRQSAVYLLVTGKQMIDLSSFIRPIQQKCTLLEQKIVHLK